jgi:hypothetical protein
LTLRTAVPSGWAHVLVSQGGSTSHIQVIAGVVQYNALPNQGEIHIQPE